MYSPWDVDNQLAGGVVRDNWGKRLKLIIISDGTGETATTMTRAAMKQFQQHDIYFTRYKNVLTIEQVEAIFAQAAISHDLVIYTVVKKEIREHISRLSRTKHVRVLDLLGPMLTSLSNFFDTEPDYEPGLLRQVDREYFVRVDAMEFTLNHDDGRNLESLHLADAVLVGISRTSKTPLSLYLSLHGIKVVNVPLVHGTPLPEALGKIDQRKIFGLTINPDVLYNIRKNRLHRLRQKTDGGNYASLKKVLEEVEWADKIFAQNRKWPTFDVTGKALEETATEIMRLLQMKKSNMFKAAKKEG